MSSPWASGIAIILAILWTIPTFGLFVTSFRPPADIATSGWWTFFANPGITFENYTNAWSELGGRARWILRQLVRDRLPGGADSDQPGAARGVLLRLDRVPGPGFPVRRDLRSADRADAGHPDPVADDLRQLRPAELVLAGVDLAHHLRPAAGDLPAAQLHEGGPGVHRRGRPGGRRRPRQDLLRGAHAAADPGHRRLRHLPVPVGLERPAGGYRLRAEPEPAADHCSDCGTVRHARAVSGSCCPQAHSSRSSFRWPCSSACSATSSEACWPEASRADRPGSEETHHVRSNIRTRRHRRSCGVVRVLARYGVAGAPGSARSVRDHPAGGGGGCQPTRLLPVALGGGTDHGSDQRGRCHCALGFPLVLLRGRRGGPGGTGPAGL